jgi:hypothetical protein
LCIKIYALAVTATKQVTSAQALAEMGFSGGR